MSEEEKHTPFTEVPPELSALGKAELDSVDRATSDTFMCGTKPKEDMSEAKHVELPWRQQGPVGAYVFGPGHGHGRAQDSCVGLMNNPETAAFVVRACNNHYDLLEACRGLCRQEDWGGEDINPRSPIGKARAAIAKAEATP